MLNIFLGTFNLEAIALIFHLISVVFYLGYTGFIHLHTQKLLKQGSFEREDLNIFGYIGKIISTSAIMTLVTGVSILVIDYSNHASGAEQGAVLYQSPRAWIKILVFFFVGITWVPFLNNTLRPLFEKAAGKPVKETKELLGKIPRISIINTGLLLTSFFPLTAGIWHDLRTVRDFSSFFVLALAWIVISFGIGWLTGAKLQQRLEQKSEPSPRTNNSLS